MADCESGEWRNPRIMPYGKMELSPSTSALHHGQSIFEGMKAFKNTAGEIFLFRPLDNFNRLNRSAERMCMPFVPQALFMEGLLSLIKLDAAWIPATEGKSLYIRPLYFATDEVIGVKPSENYRLVVFTSPTGPYFNEPLNVLVETNYSRSAEGGTGYAKAAGNYGGAMYPTRLAQQKGYHAVIWTDAVSNKWVEEGGAMNLFFMFGEKLVTPPLSNSKLAGITRDSIITVAKDWNIEVEERNISTDELISAFEKGLLNDAFGCGTAANIAHIASINVGGKELKLKPVAERSLSNKLLGYLNDYRLGRTEDKFGWLTKV
jgi:branched-chain amino acid aminotransferase